MNLEQLKRECGQMLKAYGLKPTTKTGKSMIHFFWEGAMHGAQSNHPFVTLCLISGRFDDLVEMPE